LGFLTDLNEDQEMSTNEHQSYLKSLFSIGTKHKPNLKPIIYNPKRNSDSFKLFTDDYNIDNNILEIGSQPPLPLPDGPPPPLKVISNTNVVRTNIIKQFLSLFLNRRPPIEQLKNKGIIQG
jgi:hypothetical protein